MERANTKIERAKTTRTTIYNAAVTMCFVIPLKVACKQQLYYHIQTMFFVCAGKMTSSSQEVFYDGA